MRPWDPRSPGSQHGFAQGRRRTAKFPPRDQRDQQSRGFAARIRRADDASALSRSGAALPLRAAVPETSPRMQAQRLPAESRFSPFERPSRLAGMLFNLFQGTFGLTFKAAILSGGRADVDSAVLRPATDDRHGNSADHY